MKAVKQFFPVVLLIKMHKMVLTLECPVDETIKCASLNRSHLAIQFYRGSSNKTTQIRENKTERCVQSVFQFLSKCR